MRKTILLSIVTGLCMLSGCIGSGTTSLDIPETENHEQITETIHSSVKDESKVIEEASEIIESSSKAMESESQVTEVESQKQETTASTECLPLTVQKGTLIDASQNPIQLQGISSDQALVFFDKMASKYAGIPNVIYEICNEPNGQTTWDDVKAYALDVIPVIRSHSPDSIILVGTPTWCQDIEQAAANPISEYENIMYTVHFYASTHTADLRNRVQTAAASGLPIFVSEFGISESSGNGTISVEEANQWLSLLNEYNISYCMWDFCNKDESAAFISSSCTKNSGFTYDELTDSGKWFVNRIFH